MENLKIKLSSETIRRYADLDYDAWYAIAEFVDNSLHAYVENKMMLNQLGVDKCKVKLSIEPEEITILDNAGGVEIDEHPRLFSIGEKKKNCETQLSQFGMGMKTSAFWLANSIEIETKHFDDQTTYLFNCDTERFGQDDEIRKSIVLPSCTYAGFTKITLTKLNRILTRKREKIKKALASIYRKYIEAGELEILFMGESLNIESYTIAKDDGGEKHIKNFTIEVGGKKCNGWIGIMDVGQTGMSGFSVYRYNRLIMGYPENSWRPKEVFGSEGGSNSSKNQRLIGELDMTDFGVAHTKNKVVFKGDEEDRFRDQLKEHCQAMSALAGKNWDEIRGNTSEDPKEYNKKKDVEFQKGHIQEYLRKPTNIDLRTVSYTEDVTKTDSENVLNEIIQKDEWWMSEDLRHIDGLNIIAKVAHFGNIDLPYILSRHVEDIVYILVNIHHPYFNNMKRQGPLTEQSFKVNCMFDVLSDFYCKKNKESYKTEDIIITKDFLLRKWCEYITASPLI